MLYNRIEINKMIITKEILHEVKEYVYSKPNNNYALLSDLHFHKMQNININHLLKEPKYKSLFVLYDIKNESEYDNFIKKYSFQ